MLPQNAITPVPVYAGFLAPLQGWTYTPLQEKVLGGTALGDGTAGRAVRNWFVTYVNGNIVVNPEGGAAQLTLPMAGVFTVSLGFDSNMAVAIAYQTVDGANLYYYNTLTSSYSIFPVAGASSCRSSVDDPRTFSSQGSDVIFSYIKSNVLYYRIQRDRYAIEYTVGPAVDAILTKTGFTVANRFQFQYGIPIV